MNNTYKFTIFLLLIIILTNEICAVLYCGGIDINKDGIVDEGDATILAANWQRKNWAADGDLNGDRKVNDLDASILAANWLRTCLVPAKCKTHQDCSETEFCQFANCTAEEGSCTKIPEGCLAVYMPVCGCDGHTYSNDCVMATYKASLNYTGVCKTKLLLSARRK